MKRVLIALDYDPSSIKVAEKGYELAKMMGAEAVLMHVLSEPEYYSPIEYSPIMGFNAYLNMGNLKVETIQGLKKAARNFLDRTKYHLKGENIKTLIKEGETAESILESAKNMDADIIVLGSHSRKWLDNILLGSVAESVLKQSTLPLFIVPIKNRENSKEEIHE